MGVLSFLLGQNIKMPSRTGVYVLCFKASVFLLCLLFFVYLIYSEFERFVKQRTSISTSTRKDEEGLHIPSITICDENPYKSTDNVREMVKSGEYDDNTFDLSDLVTYEHTSYSVQPVKTIFYGKCFNFNRKIRSTSSGFIAKIQMKTGSGKRYKVYFHMDYKLIEIIYGKRFLMFRPEDMSEDLEDSSMQCKLVENREDFSEAYKDLCRDYTEEEFYACFEKKFTEKFEKSRSCRLPWDRQEKFPECETILESEKEYHDQYSKTRRWMDKMRRNWTNLANLGCPAPCVQIFFDRQCGPPKYTQYIFGKFYNDMEVDQGQKHLTVYLWADIKELSHYMVTDMVSILASVGGALGLCLGFSLWGGFNTGLNGLGSLTSQFKRKSDDKVLPVTED